MRVVLWGSFGKAEIEKELRGLGTVDLTVVENRDEALAALPEAGALVLPGNLYDAAMAEAVRGAPRLRWIQLLTAGYETLQRHGVPPRVAVSNAGDSWSPAVAEHVMTLLLTLIKRVPDIVDNHRNHGWERGYAARMRGLDGMTLAIVGYGSIGRAVAARARPFGMRVVGLSRSARPDPGADEVMPIASLHDALARADAILLSLPLSDESRHVMNRDAFAACKQGALLVNIARGELIDSEALIDALKSGRIGGAGLDVTAPEPLPPGDPLWDAPNLIVSPHVAGACGARGRERLAGFVTSNMQRFIAGETPEALIKLDR